VAERLRCTGKRCIIKKEEAVKIAILKSLESLISDNDNEKLKMTMVIFIDDDTEKVNSVNVIIEDNTGESDG